VPLKLLKFELAEAFYENNKERETELIKPENLNFPIEKEKTMPLATKFDNILTKATRICKKYWKEVDIAKEELMWYSVLDALVELKLKAEVSDKSFCIYFF